MKIENVISFDLELNQPSNTIIQFGYCIGNLKSGEILYKNCMDIHTSEVLAENIISLTGIKQEQVTNSCLNLQDVYISVKEKMAEYDVFRNPLVWGGGDVPCFQEQYQNYMLNTYGKKDDSESIFGRRWLDCKTVYLTLALSRHLPLQGGLAKTMSRFGMRFTGRKHNALDDAINTFLLYVKLIETIRR